MNNPTEALNTCFNIALQSRTNSDFYQSIYRYFDLIQKTPELKLILDESEEEHDEKLHNEIWKEKKETYPMAEANEKFRQMFKLNRFTLSTSSFDMYERIYLAIENYRNKSEPDKKQDSSAVILVHGIDYAVKLKAWGRKRIEKQHRSLENNRGVFESELRQFHAMFLVEMAKPRVQTVSKPKISFDTENSVLKIGDKKINIKLKNDKPISHYVLEYIFESKEGLTAQSFYSEIIEAKFLKENFEWRSIYRACNDINKKVSEQASISNFLIIKSGQSGYTQINHAYM